MEILPKAGSLKLDKNEDYVDCVQTHSYMRVH